MRAVRMLILNWEALKIWDKKLGKDGPGEMGGELNCAKTGDW